VRASADLKRMNVFVAALGEHEPQKVADALNRCAGFLRGKLARGVNLRFSPELHFIPDLSYNEASHIDALLRSPEVKRDLGGDAPDGEQES
jgi:ribosome-binding factor A